MAGLLLDLTDFLAGFAIKSPRVSALVGLAIGFGLGSKLKLPLHSRIKLALIGAAYCAVTATTHLPLGTLVAFYLRAKRAKGG